MTDPLTGLVWQLVVDEDSYTQAEALAYCARFALAGGGWRLPTLPELESLVDTQFSPTIDPDLFPNAPAGWFWSSSPNVGAVGQGWFVSFNNGESVNAATTARYRARCVR